MSRRCSAASAAISDGCLSHGTSGCRRIVPVEEHGASRSTASNGSAVHSSTSAQTNSASSDNRARFPRRRSSRAGERSTAVRRAPAAASCAALPPGAAQRSATRSPPTLPNRRAGKAAAASCTHQAPSANPGSDGDGAMGDGPHRAGRQHPAVKLGGPRFGVALHCEVESRLMAMGSGDGAGGGLAVVLAPARHQPRRRVENGRVEGREPLRPFTRDAPQYGVDEAGIARRLPVRLREPHRKIDGGVIRHIEKENLGRSDEQCGLDARRLRAAGLRLRQRPMRWRSVPSRRSAVAVSARTSARSRSASSENAARAAAAANSSSRARRRRSTPSRTSAAMRRAVKPGTSSAGRCGRVMGSRRAFMGFLRTSRGASERRRLAAPAAPRQLGSMPSEQKAPKPAGIESNRGRAPGAASADDRGPACARGSGRPPRRARPQAGECRANGSQRARRPRSNALWRLGNQRTHLGFLVCHLDNFLV